MERILLLLALTVGLTSAAAGAATWSPRERQMLADSGVFDEDLIAALDHQETVRAIIVFAMPGAAASSRIAVGTDPRGDAGIRSVGLAILDRFAPGEFDVIRQFPSLGVLSGWISRAGVLRVLDDPRIRRVGLDPPVVPQLSEAVPFANLHEVHALGFTGEGVTVAVIDSGIDTDHPDLSDDLVGERCICSSFGGCCPDGSSDQSGPGSAEDDDGHGTFTAGIVTSGGVVSPPGGAPDAGILAVKVTGPSVDIPSAVTDVLFAGHWIYLERPDVDVINMSLTTPAVFEGPCDDYDTATWVASVVVEALRGNNVVLLACAGNEGSGTGMGLPACLSGVIGVGAVYDDDFGAETFYSAQSDFTCTDPTTQADQVTCFSNSDATTVVFASGAHVLSPALGGGIEDGGGTSAAAPLAASCAALLKQKHPAATPALIEKLLRKSATWVTDPKNGLSFPRLDCAAALAALPACDDGEDNDADGLIDYPEDPGCKDALSNLESPQCQDGLNNDSVQDPYPGLKDFDGGQSIWGECTGFACTPPETWPDCGCPPQVSDPDADGVADPDAQCIDNPWRNCEATRCGCGLGIELLLLLPPLMWLSPRRRRVTFGG